MTEQQILQEVIDRLKSGVIKKEEKDSGRIIPIDESKFAQIYGKAKGRIKEVFSKIKLSNLFIKDKNIKSFFNIKSKDRNDKTNDEI